MSSLSVARRRRALICALLVLPLLVATCVDAPSGLEEGGGVPAGMVIAPVLSLVGPGGERPQTAAQQDALAAAFDLVDRFRMVVRRASDNVVVLDTVIVVTPGQSEYDLTVPISAKTDEQFLVTLTAMQGTTTLFTAENIPARAAPAGVPGSAPPAAVQVPLVYTGPGSTAASVTVGPTQVVLSPGGSATVGSSVKDAGGAVVAGVPVSWATSASGVATVSASGVVTAVGDGLATVTVTTPTGLSASATIYVVAGELAYVEGGTLKVRGVVSGTPTERATGGASQPSWRPDGSKLYYVASGSVREAGGASLVEGSWPSVSPDGTKLAVQRGGNVWFANDDGTRSTLGPSGSSPVWADAATLLVAGGSVERVKADGTGRTTVVAGEATLPALAPDGRVAALVGGALRVTGLGSALVTGATGRATWSSNGRWLVVATGSGLVLVSADGSAAAVALPGLGSASEPAFKPTGTLSAPPSLTLTGTNPDPPLPGGSVRLLGSGFDWIIPANNRVSWPVPGGSAAAEVKAVRETYIEVVIPRSVAAGQIRVDTRTASATLGFEPKYGALDVTARTPWGAPVAGVGITLTAGGDRVSGTTDADGTLMLSGIVPGSYTATFSAPSGFRLLGSAQQTLSIGVETASLALQLSPVVASVVTVPSALALEVGGGALDVRLDARDAAGNTILQATASWSSPSLELAVSGSGLSGSLSGVFASASQGSSTLNVELDGKSYTFPVSVTSFIAGSVMLAGTTPAPAPGVQVLIKRAGSTVADLTTDAQGHYRASGLYQGTYDVTVLDAQGRVPSPSGQTVILSASSPSGSADFQLLAFSKLAVTAKTPWDAVVAGVRVTLKDAQGQTVASGETGQDGTLVLDKLKPATYTLQVQAPQGYDLATGTPTSVTLSSETQALDLQLTPRVASLKTEPEELLVEVGDGIGVTLLPFDVHGQPIPRVDKVTWNGSGEIEVTGDGLSGSISGVHPSTGAGAAKLTVTLGADQFSLDVSVVSYITGKVQTQATEANPAKPVAEALILVHLGETLVASKRTDGLGGYVVAGLFAGTYSVSVAPSGDLHPVPSSRELTLGKGHPTGTADFTMSAGDVYSIDATVSPDPLHALGATAQVTVLAFDSVGAPLGARTATYVSKDPAIATVDATGKVTAVSNGSTWIRATAEAKVDSVLVTVDQEAATIEFTELTDEEVIVAAPDSIRRLVQDTWRLTYRARDARGHLIPAEHREPDFTSADPTMIHVSADTANLAYVQSNKVGRTELTATMDEASDILVVGVHGVRSGDLSLPGDLAVLADSLYGKVMGSILVEETSLTNLHALRTVWDVLGEVNIRTNPSLTNLAGMAGIETIGGTLRIEGNGALATPGGLGAAALKSVGGNLKIWDNHNPGFTNADMFGNLVEVGGSIDISGNDYLEDLSGVASLKQAYGLSLESNESLDLDGAFPALEYLGWDGLWIDESATVARLPMLKGVEGGVGVGGEVEEVNPIQELDLPALTCVEGGVWIYDNQELEAVRMPNLVSVGTSCATPFDFDDLEGVTPMARSAASPAKDPDPTDRGMARFRGTAEARIRALDQEARTRLEQRRSERETRRIEAAREAAALRGPAGALAVPDRLRARAPRAEEPQANGCECGPGLMMEDNYHLTTLDLGSLEEVGGPLYLYEMYDLEIVDLPELLTVGEWLNIWELYSLTAFRAPKLEYAADFHLQIDFGFSEIDLSSLRETGGFEIHGPYYPGSEEVSPMGAPSTTEEGLIPWDLDLPDLETVGGWFHVHGPAGVTSINAPLLATVGGVLEIDELENLETVDLGSLESVGEAVRFSYLWELQTLSLPSLLSVGEDPYYEEPYFEVADNAVLESIEAPNLEAYLYRLAITDNNVLEDFDLAGVFAQYVYIIGNGQLTSLPDLSGLGMSEGTATLVIEYNPELLDLDGLAGVNALEWFLLSNNAKLNDLTALGTEGDELDGLGRLTVVGNAALQSLNGLGHVVSPLDQLQIQGNPLLTDISGLSAIGTLSEANPAVSGMFSVSGNITLSDCHVYTVMDTIAGRFVRTRETAFHGGWTVNNVPCGGQQEQ